MNSTLTIRERHNRTNSIVMTHEFPQYQKKSFYSQKRGLPTFSLSLFKRDYFPSVIGSVGLVLPFPSILCRLDIYVVVVVDDDDDE